MKKLFVLFTCLLGMALSVNANSYKVGDIYDQNGVKGMVVVVDESGEHGLLLSLDGDGSRWCKNSVKLNVGATDQNDGEKNMERVASFIEKHNSTWDDFPLFKWAHELGDGWYIPSVNELKTIAEVINGGNLDKYNEKSVKQYGKILKKNGGKGFTGGAMGKSDFLSMYASTESVVGTYELTFKESTGSKIASSVLRFGKLGARKGKLTINSGVKTVSGGGMMARSRAVHKF